MMGHKTECGRVPRRRPSIGGGGARRAVRAVGEAADAIGAASARAGHFVARRQRIGRDDSGRSATGGPVRIAVLG